MRKIVLFALMGCLLLCCVCCSAETPEVIPEFDTTYEFDLTGLSFRHGSAWQPELCPSVGFSSAGDKVHARIAALKEKYGCTYVFENWEDGSANILRDIAAGRQALDFLDSHADAGGYSLYRSGALVALEDIPNIDLNNEKWGSMSFRQYGVFDGKTYGFYQYAWEFMPEYAGILLFNGELMHSAGLPYPYEYQEAGDWTWDNFRQVLETCNENLFASIPSFRPFVSTSILFDAEAFIFSNGGSLVVQGSDGIYKANVTNEQTYKALEFLAELRSADLYSSEGIAPFNESRAAFVGCESYYATHHYENDNYPVSILSDFGLIQCPYGPNGNPDLPTGFVHAHRRLNWVVGFSEKSLDEIGLVMDFMYEPLDDAGGWRDYAESQIFHHTEGFENYQYQLDNINYNYGVQANALQSNSYFESVVLGRSTASEAMASLSAAVQVLLDQNMNDPSLQNK